MRLGGIRPITGHLFFFETEMYAFGTEIYVDVKKIERVRKKKKKCIKDVPNREKYKKAIHNFFFHDPQVKLYS